MPARARSSHAARGARERTLRIIAGRWRGRSWQFPALDIRPTPDRVRETLFNWLRADVSGARCLDLYAGSGALGLEALSRGAASVVFIERGRAAAAALMRLLGQWQADGGRVLCGEALTLLGVGGPAAGGPDVSERFELAFLDPPYAAGELGAAAALLEQRWLAPRALIYLEHPRRAALPELPALWRELRSGRAGEVGYHLFERTEGGSGP